MTDASPRPARKPRILLVGHCRPDAAMLRSALRPGVPEAEFESANDRAQLEARLAAVDLLLVNRALEGDFGVADGVELIRGLAGRGREHGPDTPASHPALMLVSMYPEAQEQAVAAGALPGFGKPDADNEVTRRLIADALARTLIR